jgi:hypothetical protein
LATVGLSLRKTIAKAFGFDDATLLERSRCHPDASQIEPGPNIDSRLRGDDTPGNCGDVSPLPAPD